MVRIRLTSSYVVLNPLQTVLIKTRRMMRYAILMRIHISDDARPAVSSGSQFLSAPLISEDYDRCLRSD